MAGDLDVTNDPLRIFHRGKGRPRIDFNPPTDPYPDPLDRIFEVFSALRLERVVLTDGGDPANAMGKGGAIRALGDLDVVSSAISGNESPSYGGAIQVEGPQASATITRSVVSGNSASSCGGGIHTEDGARLTLRRTKVNGNRASFSGGGVSASCFDNAGPLRMSRSSISRNVSENNALGGGIYLQTNAGVASTIDDSVFERNRGGGGGGIYTDLGTLRLTDSSITGNRSADFGGGIEVDGTDPLTIINSTITRNRAESNGGGIRLDTGRVIARSITVARNLGNSDGLLNEAGGGIYTSGDPFEIENSLIALNRLTEIGGGGTVANDCAGSAPFISQGHNLLSTAFLCDGFTAPGDRVRSRVKLGQLKRNGGPTKTIALKKGSPAIGKADRQKRARTRPARAQAGQQAGHRCLRAIVPTSGSRSRSSAVAGPTHS